MMDKRLIERELLLSALDEDAVLSAAENLLEKTGADVNEVLAFACRLAEDGFLEFYKYADDQAPVVIGPEEILTEIRDEPYGVFLQQTDATAGRLAILSQDGDGPVSA
ncbi:hypothetical protein [Neorhizobium sp. JUb45]|uniref:hypothetical protein n=1 Tax=unclassified Neorhizobium TaxID=2629175 RepID=UPI001052B852|nr:hypothetical protein [Neorhizobium sp. JUb45]TCR04054.1 hypothetical protein EDF70_102150 [Neorhizobium sp. JUb45]